MVEITQRYYNIYSCKDVTADYFSIVRVEYELNEIVSGIYIVILDFIFKSFGHTSSLGFKI